MKWRSIYQFIIDTGCQVTILASSVFERMCASEPQVRARLRPCRCRLVSADSSPLSVKGERELTIVFPGLSCDIGSDGLLGTEALQSCLPHQLDLRTGQCGRMVDRRYSCTNRDLIMT